MFRDSANTIDELTTSITGFIRKCIEDVVPTVRVRCFPNQKAWINTEFGAKLQSRATAHRNIADNPDATVPPTTGISTRRPAMTSDSHQTGSNARRICTLMPLYQTNSMCFMQTLTTTTASWV
jgi:hypothetical protein